MSALTSNATTTTGHTRVRFGKYSVLGLLGQGGMARVYLAASSSPGGVNKLLVVKELRGELACDPVSRAMFIDEARVATRLSHPNVVQTHEVVEDGGAMYLTMEYLEGQPLQHVLTLAHREPISHLLVLRVLSDVLAGLQYVHDLADYDGSPLSLVHRDVSPHNIFVTYDGLVKLVDFGVAKASDASTNTATGTFKGKVRYASPEQAVGGQVDRRADIFSLGIVLWELTAGRRMWAEKGDTQILLHLANGEIPSVRAFAPEVHPDLEAIIGKALAFSAADRYGSAEEMRADLLSFVESQSTRGMLPELGSWMRTSFASQRTTAKQFVDAQMQALRDVPRIEVRRERTSEVVEGSGSTALASVQETRAAAGMPIDETAPPKRRAPLLLIGTAIALGLVAFSAVRSSSSPKPPPVAAALAPPAPALALASARLGIQTDPSGARVLLDGVELGVSPYSGSKARDGKEHVLSVSATGYVAREERVTLDRDIDLRLELKAVPAATRPEQSATVAPVARAAPPPPPPAMPGKRPDKTPPRRTIYEDNPYPHN